MKSTGDQIFEFYSSLTDEQQESLEAKWSEDPASAVDEALNISTAAGFSFDRDTLEFTVKALLDEDGEADIELSPEVMAAVSGGGAKRRKSSRGSKRSGSSAGRSTRRASTHGHRHRGTGAVQLPKGKRSLTSSMPRSSKRR